MTLEKQTFLLPWIFTEFGFKTIQFFLQFFSLLGKNHTMVKLIKLLNLPSHLLTTFHCFSTIKLYRVKNQGNPLKVAQRPRYFISIKLINHFLQFLRLKQDLKDFFWVCQSVLFPKSSFLLIFHLQFLC